MNTTSEKGTDQTHELTFRRQRHNKERGLARRSITHLRSIYKSKLFFNKKNPLSKRNILSSFATG